MTHNKEGHRSKQQLAGLISYMREGSTSRVCMGVKDVQRRGKASRRLAPHPPAAATWSRGNPHTGLESDTRTEKIHPQTGLESDTRTEKIHPQTGLESDTRTEKIHPQTGLESDTRTEKIHPQTGLESDTRTEKIHPQTGLESDTRTEMIHPYTDPESDTRTEMIHPYTDPESDTRTEIVHDAVSAVATWSQWGRLCCPCLQLAYNQRKFNRVLLTQCYSHKPLLRKECSCGTPYQLHKMLDSAHTKLAALGIVCLLENLFCLFISIPHQ